MFFGTIDPAFFSYIIWDEAHHTEAETFRAVRSHFKPNFELALTATPQRADGRDILTYFGKPLFVKSLADGIADGWLSAIDYHIVFDETIKKAMRTGFEAQTLKEIKELFAIRPRNEVISQEVLQRRHDIGMDQAKTIVFCHSTEASEEMAALLGGEAYHSDIEADTRIDILRRFRNGDLQVICTVDMFNEGIDIPDARLIVFLRSTSSRTIFEQQLGRGLRRAPDKDKVTVLDFVANVERINFVRNLNQTINRLHRGGRRYSGLKTDGNPDRSALEHPAFLMSSFEFDDQAIDLLDRYETLKSAEYLTRDVVVNAYHELRSVSKVAEKFSVSMTAIYKHLKRAGIDTSGHLKNIPTETIVTTYFEMGSANKASKVLGLDSTTILQRVKKAGYQTLSKPERRWSDQQLIEAYEHNNHSVRATARELKTDRNVVYRRLRALGINTARISKGPVIAPQQLEESYQTHRGDITKMVEQLGTSWIDVYKALDEYGYLERHRRPVTCAQAAAAYYKFGSTTKAGEHLGVSATLIRKKSREAKYIRKYGRGRKNKVIV